MINDKDIAQRLGPILRRARIDQGLSQSDVSEALQLGISDLSRYENGWTMPTWNRFLGLCKVLSLHPGDLLMTIATQESRRKGNSK